MSSFEEQTAAPIRQLHQRPWQPQAMQAVPHRFATILPAGLSLPPQHQQAGSSTGVALPLLGTLRHGSCLRTIWPHLQGLHKPCARTGTGQATRDTPDLVLGSTRRDRHCSGMSWDPYPCCHGSLSTN